MNAKTAIATLSGRLFIAGAVIACILAGVAAVFYRQAHSQPPVLRVGYNLFPPYTLPTASGPPEGLAAEMVIRAAKLAKIRLQWVFIENQTAEDALAGGKIDLFAMLSVTEERLRAFHMSQPWWENDMTLISLERARIPTSASSAGKRIALRGMPVAARLARGLFPQAEFVTIPRMEQMLPALCAGAVDGVFLDLRLVQSQLLQGAGCPGRPLYVASLPHSSLSLATASTWSAAPVADRLYESIALLLVDGTLSEIASKWSLYNPYSGRHMKDLIDAQHRTNMMRYGLGGMTLVLVLIGLQSLRLRRERALASDARGEADESRQRFDAFMKFTPAVTYIKDAEGRVVYGNRAYRELFSGDVIGRFEREFMPNEFAEEYRKNDALVLAANEGSEFTEKACLPSGEVRHYLTLKFPFANREGQKLLGGVSLDITERKLAEEALRHSQFCMDSSPDTILWINADSRIFYANQAAVQNLGYNREELIGMELAIVDPKWDYDSSKSAARKLKTRRSITVESSHRVKEGRSCPVELSVNYLEFGGDEFCCLMARDITERKRAESELSHQAQHDLLTGLPNRRLLETRLARVLESAPSAGVVVGVIYLDLDGFKLVNDSLGHVAGDNLLQQVSRRLSNCISHIDTLARMGGDEFTLILDRLRVPSDAQAVAERLLEALNEAFDIDGHEILVTASAGISVFPRDGIDVNTLLQSADAAMYDAKRRGKNKVQNFTLEMREAVGERLELETQLRRALERKELSLHFQPQVSLGAAGGVVRYEALLRWNHPVLGSIPPAKFIPIAEETGLIVPIGAWVLEEACRNACHWRNSSDEDLGVGVNVSVVQFLRPDFVETVIDVLDRTGLPPCLLELEITESVIMQGTDDPVSKIEQLRALGISISIDNFGTGYSSLSYLQRLPIDCLKIDRAFIRDIPGNQNSVAVAAALVTLAHSLGMKVVSEGIETPQQLDAVTRIGCDIAQGYLLGRPAPIDSLLRARKTAAA